MLETKQRIPSEYYEQKFTLSRNTIRNNSTKETSRGIPSPLPYDNKDGAYSSIYDHHSLSPLIVTYIHVSLKHRNSFEYLIHGGMKIREI